MLRILVLAACLACCPQLFALEKGELVVAVRSTSLKDDQGALIPVAKATKFVIGEVRDTSLFVTSKQSGWIERREVVGLAYGVTILTEAIKDNPQSAELYKARGAAYYARHEYKKANADLNEVVRLDPNDIDAYRTMGEVLVIQGPEQMATFDARIDAYSQVIRLAPTDASAYVSRAKLFKQRFDLRKAFADFSRAIELDPDCQAAYSGRAEIWFDERYGRVTKNALEDCAVALRLDPQDAQAHFVRANALLGTDNDQAFEAYETAVRLRNHLYWIHNWLDLLERSEDQKRLEAAYEYTLQSGITVPGVDKIHNSLAWLYATSSDANLRDADKAIRHAQLACDLTKRWPIANYLDTLASASAQAGNFKDAVIHEEEALKLSRDAAFEARLALYQKGMPYRSDKVKKSFSK